MFLTFAQTGFSLTLAVSRVRALINASTDLNFQQKNDCNEALLQIADEAFEPGLTNIDKSIQYTGTYGYTCYINYFANQNYDKDLLNASVSLQIDSTAPTETGTVTPAVSTVTVPGVTVTPWVPGPVPALPAVGALSANFTAIQGISVILPNTLADIDIENTRKLLSYHITAGNALVTNSTNYIKASVVVAAGGNIPAYTSVTMFIDGVVHQTGYSAASGLHTSIDLYHNFTTNGTYNISIVVETTGDTPWIPSTTINCYGGVRFTDAACRGFVVGLSAVPDYPTQYDIALYTFGSKKDTYLSEANLINAYNFKPLNFGRNFTYTFNSLSGSNPVYGQILSSSTYTATGGAKNKNIYDAVLTVTTTKPLTSSPVPFKIYTPYTFAITGTPVWIQTVLPDSNNFTSLTANWGDGTIDTYTNTVSTELYFAHTYSAAGNYNAIITGYNGTEAKSATATYNIQNYYSNLDLNDYSETLGVNLTLPYNKNEIGIGSNEWVVADNINASYNKLQANFDYLNKITSSIKKSPDFTLAGWVRDLVAYPYWNTALSGSNLYYSASGAYTGVIPSESIIDFKSYKNQFAAPDYYNYIAYDNGLLQIRKNNFNNTLVNQLTAVTNNSEPLYVYGIDINGNDLYLLASLNQNGIGSEQNTSPVFVLRYYIGNINSSIVPVNQVGGGDGTRADNNNFNIAQPPNCIKAVDGEVYVGDVGNKCVKIYNSALTHVKTIYSTELNSYDVLQFDVNETNKNIFILGRIFAPNVPVITSVTLSAASTTSQYKVTWNHDGERLNITSGASANFNVYGQILGSNSYSLVDSISSDLSHANDPKLTTYIFETDYVYSSFQVEAIGRDGITTSGRSSSKVVPNDVIFPSPYKVFVYSNTSTLLSSFNISEVPSSATIKKILIDPDGIFFYILTEEYLYKYTTNGLFVNRIASPSKTSTSLGPVENIITGFIDTNYYFYVITKKRVYKFIDVPSIENIINNTLVDTYYTPNSSITINSNEFVVDWVYNKALKPLLFNHEILAKNINKKYVVTVDSKNNLVDFSIRNLSATELINSLSADRSNYIYSNEIISSAVVNRTINRIYDVQEAILNVLTPEVIVSLPSATTNILGKVTSASSVQVTAYKPEVIPTTTTTAAPLPVLFSFASATYVGNLYSDLYGGSSRYGNDYVAYFNLINATSACILTLELRESTGGSSLALPVEVTVKQNNSIIYTYNASSSATLDIPLSATLITDSASIAADGIVGTYGDEFTVELAVGSTTSGSIVKPYLSVFPSNGRMYNAKLKNSLMGTTGPTCSIAAGNVTGSYLPYAGISNNTLGGYLTSNPYASHTWTIDGNANAVNPTVNHPITFSTIQINATRSTAGESELLLALNRTVIEPPAVPTYTLSTTVTQTAGTQIGSGYVNGGGTYAAGSIIPVFAVATYGTFGRGSFSTTPANIFQLTGTGTSNVWASGPTGSLGYNISDKGGRWDGTIFIDGNKSVDVGFYHS